MGIQAQFAEPSTAMRLRSLMMPLRTPRPGMPGSWVMLLALVAAFAMSQAFRTVAAILAAPVLRRNVVQWAP